MPDLRALSLRARDVDDSQGQSIANVARQVWAELAEPVQALQMIADHRFAAQREKGVTTVGEVELDLFDYRSGQGEGLRRHAADIFDLRIDANSCKVRRVGDANSPEVADRGNECMRALPGRNEGKRRFPGHAGHRIKQ